MRIIFVGTVEFSLRSFLHLLNLGADIVGLITKKTSSFNADFANLSIICEEKQIPYIYASDINSEECINWAKELNPDIIFCFGWSSLLKKEFLELTQMGVLGYHPALLPLNRGRHPIVWSLALGLPKTGSTFFFMDLGADSGDILSQEEIEIKSTDDAKSLYEKTIQTALLQITNFLPLLQAKTYCLIPQNHSQANYWRKRGRRDGQIDFRMSSETIYNLVRALTRPYVGSHIEIDGKDIKVWKVKILNDDNNKNLEYGKVLEVDTENHAFIVKTADGAIEIIEHDFEQLPQINAYL